MSGRRKIGRNDPCHCGSGRKYKQCHLNQDKREGNVVDVDTVKIPRSEQTLVDNTLGFIEYVKELFGITFDPRTGTGNVAGSVTRSKVKNLYQNVPAYFPHKAPFKDICRDIASNSHTGMYWGTPNINHIVSHLIRYALYVPRIVVTNPFCDMMIYHVEASPLDVPDKWKQIAVNQALFLASIEPWIREGIVILLPPVQWFDYELFKRELVPLSETNRCALNEEQNTALMWELFVEQLHNWPLDVIDTMLESDRQQGMSEELIQAARKVAIQEAERNPIRYRWSDRRTSLLKVGAGASLEAALFTAELCDAHLLLGEGFYKKRFDFAADAGVKLQSESLTKLARAFSDLRFSFLNAVTLDFVLGLRKENRLDNLRNFLGRLWRDISSLEELNGMEKVETFVEDLKDQYETYRREWEDISGSLTISGTSALVGTGAAILSGQFDMRIGAGVFASLGLHALLASYDERRKKKKHPLGVFLKLDRSAK